MRMSLGIHAGNLLHEVVDAADPLVEFVGQPDALLQVSMNGVSLAGDFQQVLPQLAVLADDPRALLRQRGRLLQAVLNLLHMLQALRDGGLHLSQSVVHALRDLLALVDQPLSARQRLLEPALRPVALPRPRRLRAVPRRMELADPPPRGVRRMRAAGPLAGGLGQVQLWMLPAVLLELELRHALEPAGLARAKVLARLHLFVGLLPVPHAPKAEALVEIAAVLLELAGRAVAVLQRLGLPVVALASPVAELPDELAGRVVAEDVREPGR